MDLHLLREPSTDGVTIGKLFVNGQWQWFTCEDEIRLPGDKVFGETAIPAGKYQIVITYSHRFKRLLPELLRVPMFTGIRIHPGNTTADTSGCILVGGGLNKSTHYLSIVASRLACDKLQADIQAVMDQGELVWITIENPPANPAPKILRA